jgi:hypothetical protein
MQSLKRSVLLAAVLGSLAVLGAAVTPSAEADSTRSCSPVMDPYSGTRYEGVDLRRIRATGLSCTSARRVASRAHRKALGLTPPSSGVRTFMWDGWRVTGDLRYSSDRYVATRGGRRVSWRF